MKKNTIVEVIAALLLVFYVHSVVNIYIQFNGLRSVLSFYTPYALHLTWVILLTEFLIALLLFIPRTRLIGLLMSSLFSLVIIVTIFWSPHNPHDFGGVLNGISEKQKLYLATLLFILGITAFSIKVIERRTKRNKESTPSITVFT